MKVLTKIKKMHNKKLMMVMIMIMMSMLAFSVVGLCEDPTPTPVPQLELNFDMGQMFGWAQAIINVMMPILYVSMGVGLAFLIVRTLRSVFG